VGIRFAVTSNVRNKIFLGQGREKKIQYYVWSNTSVLVNFPDFKSHLGEVGNDKDFG
jgi:hypothetical protein